MAESEVCKDCNGVGLKPPWQYEVCETCKGVGPFNPQFPGQPDWKAGEAFRWVGGTKVYRSYSLYVG